MTSAITLAATALIVPGTGTHNVNTAIGYKPNARDYYMTNTPCSGTDCPDANLIGIDYPASFWPLPFPGWCPSVGCDKWNVSVGKGVDNLHSELLAALNDPSKPDQQIVIFGYSQGAAVVSNELRYNFDSLTPEQRARVTGVVVGNIDRPGGGFFTRFGFLGRIPILDATLGLATPTDTIPMYDIAMEYDGVSDFPLYPIDLLSVFNAIAGFAYIHGTYLEPNENSNFEGSPDGYSKDELLDIINDPNNIQGVKGQTTYILIPSKTLPIVMPVLAFGAATGTTPIVKPIVDLISPVLRVLIDLGYDRTLNPGDYTPIRLIPIINPFTLTVDLINASFQGIEDALKDITGDPTAPEAPDVPLMPPILTDWGTSAATTLTAARQSGQQLSMTTSSGGAPVVTPEPPTNSGPPSITDNGPGPIRTMLNDAFSMVPGKPQTASGSNSSATSPKQPKAWKPGDVLRRVTAPLREAIDGLTKPRTTTPPGGDGPPPSDNGEGQAAA